MTVREYGHLKHILSGVFILCQNHYPLTSGTGGPMNLGDLKTMVLPPELIVSVHIDGWRRVFWALYFPAISACSSHVWGELFVFLAGLIDATVTHRLLWFRKHCLLKGLQHFAAWIQLQVVTGSHSLSRRRSYCTSIIKYLVSSWGLNERAAGKND
jgi:hypothetical protein